VLLDRYYVTRTNKQLVPTILGRLICDMLVEYFPKVVDAAFTASMEDQLDQVEERRLEWPDMIRDFYFPFKQQVDEVGRQLESYKGTLDEKTDYVCEKCGRPMLKKLGRFGYFLACSGFPECHNARSVPLAKCPRPGCGGDIIARKTRGRGKEFYGCTRYPECDYLIHFKPTGETCPQCGGLLVEKGRKVACENAACNFVKKDSLQKEETANDA